VNEFLTWLLDTVQSVDPVVRTLLAGFAIMLETSVLVGLFVPGDTIVIIAATAVASPLEGLYLGIAVVIGALIGESIGFWLGRFLGPKIHHSALGRRIGEENWLRSERYLRRRGGPAIFLLAWTAPACVMWAALYISVASVAAGTYREVADQIHYAGYIFVAVIVVFIALVFVSKKVIERAEHKHLAAAEESLPDVLPSQGGIQDDVKD
jgi:membrane-associated protein